MQSRALLSMYNTGMGKPKIALIHDYLLYNGGAEKTLESITEVFPEAPIYTSIYDPKKFTDVINSRKIVCPQTVLFKMFPKYLSFLMPLVFENFDLRKYDIVLSDSSAWAKGVLTTPEQLHISYIHTPPRFLYKYPVESAKRNSWYFKPFVAVLDSLLRVWDFNAAQRPDFLIANSQEVQSRIKKFYNREASIIYPPVEILETEKNKFKKREKPYFLMVGRIVAYKNMDIIVKAFKNIPTTLVIVGSGNEENKLRELAASNVEFLGRAGDEEKHFLMEHSLGLINPVIDEDFGIVPVESMLHGRPVLAHKSGGHLETIDENVNGMFFESLSIEDIEKKIREFENNIIANKYDPERIKSFAQKYSKKRFQEELKSFVEEKWKEHVEKNA